MVKGRLESRDEGQTLLVEEARILEEKELSAEVKIPSQMSPRKLVELNKILKQSPGKDKLTLVFTDNQGRAKKMVLPFGVNFNPELKERIEKLIEE